MEPLEKWNDEYKAIDDVPKCPQEDFGSEDCLRLNVYVPYEVCSYQILSFSFNWRIFLISQYGAQKTNLPVFVYFHHGSYVFGSASRAEYGPDFLLDHDIILVMGNYRIGALGFLSTEDEVCPGNFGLKDQVMILKWVRENIKQFGGDPER